MSAERPEQKLWLSAKHSPTGTTVTATIQEGNLTARWTVKAFGSTVKTAVPQAKAGAAKAIEALREGLELLS